MSLETTSAFHNRRRFLQKDASRGIVDSKIDLLHWQKQFSGEVFCKIVALKISQNLQKTGLEPVTSLKTPPQRFCCDFGKNLRTPIL